MKNDKLTTITNNTGVRRNQDSLVFEVVRPQRKRLSRYKVKKQLGLATRILQDLQIFEA